MLDGEGLAMTVFGVALLAICTLVGVFIGDLLGVALGVKANVGGVGLAMMMLIAARIWLVRRDALSHGMKLGVEFWATMYIPIVVAMAAQQNVVAAARGGPIVLIAGIGAVAVCFACVALISRLGKPRELPPEEVAEIERGGYVIGGDTPPDYAGPAPRPTPALAAGPVSSVQEA
jgi:malonate transporter MadL subunit